MREHVFEGHARLGVDCQDSGDEVLCLRTHLFSVDWIVHEAKTSDVAVRVRVGCPSERSSPGEKLISEDSHSPDIYLFIVGLLLDQLRGHIVSCPAEGHASLIDCVSRPTKVAQLHVHPLQVHNEYVLRLDVTMNHVSVLHVYQRMHDLPDYVPRLLLDEALLLFESLVQVPKLSIL